jgi:hypothetical protein
VATVVVVAALYDGGGGSSGGSGGSGSGSGRSSIKDHTIKEYGERETYTQQTSVVKGHVLVTSSLENGPPESKGQESVWIKQ